MGQVPLYSIDADARLHNKGAPYQGGKEVEVHNAAVRKATVRATLEWNRSLHPCRLAGRRSLCRFAGQEEQEFVCRERQKSGLCIY